MGWALTAAVAKAGRWVEYVYFAYAYQCFRIPVIFDVVLVMISIRDWMGPSAPSLDDAWGRSAPTLEGPSLSISCLRSLAVI